MFLYLVGGLIRVVFWENKFGSKCLDVLGRKQVGIKVISQEIVKVQVSCNKDLVLENKDFIRQKVVEV